MMDFLAMEIKHKTVVYTTQMEISVAMNHTNRGNNMNKQTFTDVVKFHIQKMELTRTALRIRQRWVPNIAPMAFAILIRAWSHL